MVSKKSSNFAPEKKRDSIFTIQIMRKIIIILLLMLCQTMAFAGGSALLITFNNGNTAEYVLSEQPKVSFDGNMMQIVTSDVSTSYVRSEVKNFSFVEAPAPTAIDVVPQVHNTFEYRDATVRTSGSTVEVYSLDGRLIHSGTSIVSLASEPSGVYVVKTGNQVIKIKR